MNTGTFAASIVETRWSTRTQLRLFPRLVRSA